MTPRPLTLNVLLNQAATFAGLLLASLVVLWCVVPTTTTLYFDVDPRGVTGGMPGASVSVLPEATLGPRGVSVLQWLMVTVAGLGLVLALLAGVRWKWRSTVLFALGAAAAAWHMFDADAQWTDHRQGAAWIAAAMVGLAAAHLGQLPRARQWMVAALVAITIPVALEAGWYVWQEHPDSVAFFAEHRTDILASRGWAEGSQPAILYERRMSFPDATGTFGLSNVLASVAAGITLLGLGLAAGRSVSFWARLAGLAGAVAAAVVVYLTASRGAAVAMGIGLALGGWFVLAARVPRLRAITSWLLLGAIALAVLAVLLRGAVGPSPLPADGFVPGREPPGERSLLFRYQYWSAAWQIAADHPLLGSGPSGFAQQYLIAKDPLNPETIVSSHNVLIDYITMLGVGGWAWSLLLLGWLWQGGRPKDASPCPTEKVPVGGRLAVWTAVASAVLVFGLALRVRQPSLYFDSVLLWMVAAAAYTAVLALLIRARLDPATTAAACTLAAVTVLVHNQIEMAFFQVPALPLLWLLVGLAGSHGDGVKTVHPAAALDPPDVGAATQSAPRVRQSPRLLLPAGVAVLLSAGMGIVTWQAATHESFLADAAQALRRGDRFRAVELLGEAQSAAGFDENALRWRVLLGALEPASALQRQGKSNDASFLLNRAGQWVAQAWTRDSPRPVTLDRLELALLQASPPATRPPETWQRLGELSEEILHKSPYNVRGWLEAARAAAERGQASLAAARYARVLELREQNYLDSADPLLPAELVEAQRGAAGKFDENSAAKP